MSVINAIYDKVVCINLLERKDKFDYMVSQFKKHEIDVEFFHPVVSGYAAKLLAPYIQLYDGPENRKILFNRKFPNELGCMQSHYHVIKTALLEDCHSLFVFEDDCAFHKDWETIAPTYFDTLPPEADGTLLYSYMVKLEPQNVRVQASWTKGYASWSMLAYGMNRKAMERYIAIADAQPMIADFITWRMMTNERFNFYIATPPLVIPAKSLTSNIRGENKNYDLAQGQGGNIFMLGINENNYE